MQEKRQAEEKDITRFLRKNGTTQRMYIVKYMKEDIDKDGNKKKFTTVCSKTTDNMLRTMKKTKKVRAMNGMYTIIKKRPAKKEKKIADNAELSKKQDADTKQEKKAEPAPRFSEKVEKDLNLAKSLQGTAFLLEAATLLLDKIRPINGSHETVISEKKEKCQAYLASVKKISYEKFARQVVQRKNKYGAMVKKARESYNKKHFRGMQIETYDIADFRDAFSDVILQIREECECMRSASPITDEEEAVSDSCKLVSTALNETCRNDYDIVIDSYEYDEELNMFKIDISELKGTSYKISQIYLDGKNCTFSVVHGNEPTPRRRSDCTIEFYPGVEISDNSKHILTIMVRCAEFSFEIAGRHGPRMNPLSHIKNDVEMIDFKGRRGKSNTVVLKPQMGGKIQDVIESHSGKKFSCQCGKTHPCKGWIGRPHSSGIPDKSGTKYWMMIRCNDSDRVIPLRYIQSQPVPE